MTQDTCYQLMWMRKEDVKYYQLWSILIMLFTHENKKEKRDKLHTHEQIFLILEIFAHEHGAHLGFLIFMSKKK